jgi:tetratricopeptide (TPR) repeat protein
MRPVAQGWCASAGIGDVQGRFNEALRHHCAGRIDDAVAHYERAITLKPDYAETHNNLGAALAARGGVDDAVAHYERAIAIKPDYAEAHNNLGNVFKYQGKFDNAMAHYARAIAIKPTYAEPHRNRAGIRTFHPGDAEIEALEALAKRGALSPYQALQIHFALAKALEDSGDYVRAFEHLRKGNDLQHRQIKYDELATVKLFLRIATTFDRGLFDRFQGEGEIRPFRFLCWACRVPAVL